MSFTVTHHGEQGCSRGITHDGPCQTWAAGGPRPCVMCSMPGDSMRMRSDARCCAGCRPGCNCALPPGEMAALRKSHREAGYPEANAATKEACRG